VPEIRLKGGCWALGLGLGRALSVSDSAARMTVTFLRLPLSSRRIVLGFNVLQDRHVRRSAR
jgi:hypothetical protein